MRTIHCTIVSALIFSADNKLLMGKKDPAKGGVYADCWHIPGGGVDEGETKIDALIRELKEEVGLTVNPDMIELISNDGRGTSERTLPETHEKVLVEMAFHVYKVTLPEHSNFVKMKLNDDLVETKWFDMNELSSVKLTPPSVELFKKLNYLI